jgi:hypothetical protein
VVSLLKRFVFSKKAHKQAYKIPANLEKKKEKPTHGTIQSVVEKVVASQITAGKIQLNLKILCM